MDTHLPPSTAASLTSIDDALRLANESAQQLATATCYKALLARFAGTLKRTFGVAEVGFARVTAKTGRLELEPRGIKLRPETGIAHCSDARLMALGDSIRSIVAPHRRGA